MGSIKNINSYFEQIAAEYKKYAQKNFLCKAQYTEPRANRTPYKAPYEYGKIQLKTFGERTATDIINSTIPKAYIAGTNFFDIKYVKFKIPAVPISPAKYKTFNLTPKIKNKSELKRYENGA